jgi:hypothetical protein
MLIVTYLQHGVLIFFTVYVAAGLPCCCQAATGQTYCCQDAFLLMAFLQRHHYCHPVNIIIVIVICCLPL